LTEVLEILEKLFKSKLDERGRIYIPKTIQEGLLMKKGDRIYIEAKSDHFIVYTTRAIKKTFDRQK